MTEPLHDAVVIQYMNRSQVGLPTQMIMWDYHNTKSKQFHIYVNDFQQQKQSLHTKINCYIHCSAPLMNNITTHLLYCIMH